MAKLRHIALTVPDPEKAAKFYMEAFGLKRVGETDWAGASGVYLSDGVINIALLPYKSEEIAGHHLQAKPEGRLVRWDWSHQEFVLVGRSRFSRR